MFLSSRPFSPFSLFTNALGTEQGNPFLNWSLFVSFFCFSQMCFYFYVVLSWGKFFGFLLPKRVLTRYSPRGLGVGSYVRILLKRVLLLFPFVFLVQAAACNG